MTLKLSLIELNNVKQLNKPALLQKAGLLSLSHILVETTFACHSIRSVHDLSVQLSKPFDHLSQRFGL